MKNVTFESDRAIILFNSAVDDESIANLVESIRVVTQEFYYKRIDLQILSPGGQEPSLNYYIAALDSWRPQVRIDTHALTSVASASAIMLSLGDERSAGVASRLLYHHARYRSVDNMTSRKAQELQDVLDKGDARIISLLVDRALRIPPGEWQRRWETDEAATSAGKTIRAAGRRRDVGQTAMIDREALKKFGIPSSDRWRRYLGADGVTKSQKRRFLKAVYRKAFDVDQHMPATVARRIGLIDRVDFLRLPDAKNAPDNAESAPREDLVIKEWRSVFPPDGWISPQNLRRHFMIFGETGSGKTASGVLPIVDAIVQSRRSKRHRVSCVLVIDPKREIARKIETEMGVVPTMINPGRGSYVFNLMDFADDFDDTDIISQATAILKRVGTLVSNPASILAGKTRDVRDPYWPRQGVRLATTVIGLVLWSLKWREWLFQALGNQQLPAPPKQEGEIDSKYAERDAPRLQFIHQMKQFAVRAGINIVRPSAHSKIVEGRRWLEEQRRKSGEAFRALRKHGLVVQQEAEGRIAIDEMRNSSLKKCGFDVFIRWQADDSGDNWKARLNGLTIHRMFSEDLPVGMTLSARGETDGFNGAEPPFETMVIEPAQFVVGRVYGDEVIEDKEIHEPLGRNTRRLIEVPVLFRDPGRPTEREKILVVADLKREVAGSRLAAIENLERRVLERLASLDAALFDGMDRLEGLPPEDGLSFGPSGLLLLTVLQDQACGPFGRARSAESERNERPDVLEEYYYDNEYLDDGTLERRAEQYREYELFAAGYPFAPDGAGLGYCDRRYSHLDAVRLATLAMEHARRHAEVVDEFGVELCRMVSDGSSGDAEWSRRVVEKVEERNASLRMLVSMRGEIGARLEPTRVFMELSATELDDDFFLRGLETNVKWELERYEAHLHEKFGAERYIVQDDGRRDVREGQNAIALAEHVAKGSMDQDGLHWWAELLGGIREETRRRRKGEYVSSDTDKLFADLEYWRQLCTTESRGHYLGILGAAVDCFYEFSQSPASNTLYFGCEPYWEAVEARGERVIKFQDFLNEATRQTIFVLQPDLHGTDVIARSIKALFFEAILRDEERQKADHRKPLVAYVADEFHRFITADRSHGEQSFLDTCRSFGAFCVLACQSTASMKYVLHDMESEVEKVKAAISIILNNTGTKLFFRTTDEDTKTWVRSLAPKMPGSANVVEARPLSTLAPGECYAVVVDGRFVRVQLEQWGSANDGD